MGEFEYQPHLVAFIDILGFKELVNETDRNSVKLNEILKNTTLFKNMGTSRCLGT